ncbi:hypothetical protein ACVWZZ_001720 [Bradyrhizobium sp. LM6.10]
MIEVNVFVEPYTAESRCARVKFLAVPRIGENVDLTLPGFAGNVRGKVTKITHTTEIDGGQPSAYVFITPTDDI